MFKDEADRLDEDIGDPHRPRFEALGVIEGREVNVSRVPEAQVKTSVDGDV